MLSTRQLVGLGVAASLVPLNSTMIAVALPDLADDFDISTGTAGSLVTIYLVVMLVGQPILGRVIDAVGGRRILGAALVGFAAASVATAFVTTFPLVVLGRAVQAAFGAALIPSTQALLRSLTEPATRGRSFGLLGSFIGVGAASGPVIGGVMTELGGWPGIFLINAVFVGASVVAMRGLPRPTTTTRGRTSDGPGVKAVLLQRTFGAAFLTQAASTLGQYTLLLVVPIVLDDRGWSSTQIGLALTALTAGMIVMGPIGGRTGDRRGRRWPVVVGLSVAAAGSIMATAFESSSAALVVAMAVFGVGLGFAVPSYLTAALESVPEEFAGSASGMLSMSRYLGSIPAAVLLSLLLTDGGEDATVMLAVASASVVVAVAAATMLPSAVARESVVADTSP